MDTALDMDLEEVGSIPTRVRDSRSWLGGRDEEERRFLVDADEDEGEEREGEGEMEEGMPGVMGNVGVQLSRLDVHTSNLNGDGSGRAQHDDVSGSGLSTKAGIIFVCFPFF
jgi:hypothetical protein